MSDRTNLIYNGDFSKGVATWATTAGASNISASNGVLTVNTGDMYQSDKTYMFPVASGRTYKITFDLKINTKDTHPWYIALRPYDAAKNAISRSSVYKPVSATGCDTTLAAELKNGDTTVTLTNASSWPTSRTNQLIGICNRLAWGYNRAYAWQPYASKSGNVLTLKSAWNQGTFAAGTKVSEFEYGSTYDYPLIISNANLPTEWTTYECTFDISNLMYSCKYVQFGTLGYSMNYSMRNIRIECIDDIQLNHWEDDSPELTKQGVLTSPEFNDIGMPIRYVRDTINGNTVNTANHWNEFQVYNYVGENIAWGKNLTYGQNTTQKGTYSNHVATDGTVSSSYVGSTNGDNSWVILDLGYIENIHKIKIWHYYPDGRTYYNNVTEVSVDGTNWITVYKGQKPETAAGNEIILHSPNTQIEKNGELFSREIIEL